MAEAVRFGVGVSDGVRLGEPGATGLPVAVGVAVVDAVPTGATLVLVGLAVVVGVREPSAGGVVVPVAVRVLVAVAVVAVVAVAVVLLLGRVLLTSAWASRGR